jgi:hypothetical protein
MESNLLVSNVLVRNALPQTMHAQPSVTQNIAKVVFE